MIKGIVFSSGYVESGQTGHLFYYHPKGFETKLEALLSLAEDLKKKYELDFGRPIVSKCCKQAVISGFRFCPDCGAGAKDPKFDFEEFAQFVSELMFTTADSYGACNMTDALEWDCWAGMPTLMSLKKSEVLFIPQNGERAIAYSVLYNTDSLVKKELDRLEKSNSWNEVQAYWDVED